MTFRPKVSEGVTRGKVRGVAALGRGQKPSDDGDDCCDERVAYLRRSMLIREKCRELLVSALSGVKRVLGVDHSPENGLQMERSTATRTEVSTLLRLLCPS